MESAEGDRVRTPKLGAKLLSKTHSSATAPYCCLSASESNTSRSSVPFAKASIRRGESGPSELLRDSVGEAMTVDSGEGG